MRRFGWVGAVLLCGVLATLVGTLVVHITKTTWSWPAIGIIFTGSTAVLSVFYYLTRQQILGVLGTQEGKLAIQAAGLEMNLEQLLKRVDTNLFVAMITHNPNAKDWLKLNVGSPECRPHLIGNIQGELQTMIAAAIQSHRSAFISLLDDASAQQKVANVSNERTGRVALIGALDHSDVREHLLGFLSEPETIRRLVGVLEKTRRGRR